MSLKTQALWKKTKVLPKDVEVEVPKYLKLFHSASEFPFNLIILFALLLRLINSIINDYMQEESGTTVDGKGDNIFENLLFEMPELDISLVNQNFL